MANTRISDLTASASNLASTDLAPVVQTAGVGPVKMTGLQLAAGLLSATMPIGSGPILSRAAAATLQLGAADASASATVTITIATPGVVTWSSHGLSTGTPVIFSTTGALPTGITAGTTYYVIAVDANTFQIATSYANATAVSPTAVATSGSQSGTHTGTRGAVDQMFRVQSASGTANFPGADFAIQGSRGTGTGAGGSIIFQVAPAGSSGTAQNAYSTALTIDSSKNATFTGNGSFIGAITLTPASNSMRLTGFSGSAYIDSGDSIFHLRNYTAFTECALAIDAASTLALRNGNSTGAAQRFNVYNTYTSSTNYETFKIDWITTANTCLIGTEKGSSGTARALALQTDGTTRLTIGASGGMSSTVTSSVDVLTLNVNAGNYPATPLVINNLNATIASGAGQYNYATIYLQAGNGSAKASFGPSYANGTASGGAGTLWSETALYVASRDASMPLIFMTNSVERLRISDTTATFADAINVAFGTSTGTKIGTATSQKIGFWNATPIVQPTTGVAAATVAATGVGDVVAASTTFDGYTIPQIVKAMRNAGLLA